MSTKIRSRTRNTAPHRCLRKGLGFILIQTETKPEDNEDKLANIVTKHTAKKIPKGKLVLAAQGSCLVLSLTTP